MNNKYPKLFGRPRKKFETFCAGLRLNKYTKGFMTNGNTKVCPDSLLERLKSGDDIAFGELVKDNWGKIYNRANSLLDNHQDAEEVAQDTFLRARNNISSFRGECSISTWLYHIATNLARNKHWYWWRRKRSHSVSLDAKVSEDSELTFSDMISCDELSPAETAASSEFIAHLPEAINSLPSKYSEVLKLRNELDLSYEDIADKLDISVGTVKSRLSRAREFLREELCKIG